MTNIYVLDIHGRPLMPCHKHGRVKRMLKAGKAVIVNRNPFTIRLTYEIPDLETDDCILGIDPGRTNIGLCVIDDKGRVLYASDVVTRNKAIAGLMLEKKAHRQASRHGRRKRRQRREISSDKTGMARATEYWRMLPGYERPVCCKVFRNKKARFSNRKRPKGWLTPTARHLLDTHLNAVRLIAKILPLSSVVIEINRFDFVKMENPGIRNWEYQMGRLSGFKDRDEAVSCQQNHKCLLCRKKDIDHYHHIVPRSQGGSESMDNIAGLCLSCHEKVHNDSKAFDQLKEKKSGLLKKYHALSTINQVMERLLTALSDMYPTDVTTGKETKCIRELYGIAKNHASDAWCIAASSLNAMPDDTPDMNDIYSIRQFRRHDRAIIKNQRERTYKLGKKTVARNRRKRMDQKDPSLRDWFVGMQKHYGKTEARRIQSELTVIKSVRRYNDMNRILPGAIFIDGTGNRHVLSGRLSGGKYYRAFGDSRTNYPADKCRIIVRNAGLVYM